MDERHTTARPSCDRPAADARRRRGSVRAAPRTDGGPVGAGRSNGPSPSDAPAHEGNGSRLGLAPRRRRAAAPAAAARQTRRPRAPARPASDGRTATTSSASSRLRGVRRRLLHGSATAGAAMRAPAPGLRPPATRRAGVLGRCSSPDRHSDRARPVEGVTSPADGARRATGQSESTCARIAGVAIQVGSSSSAPARGSRIAQEGCSSGPRRRQRRPAGRSSAAAVRGRSAAPRAAPPTRERDDEPAEQHQADDRGAAGGRRRSAPPRRRRGRAPRRRSAARDVPAPSTSPAPRDSRAGPDACDVAGGMAAAARAGRGCDPRRAPADFTRLVGRSKVRGATAASFAEPRRPSSSSWACSTSVGAPDIGSTPAWFFGNAIASRRFGSPASIIAMRSIPNAIPPCGGAPIASASSRKPNFDALLLGRQVQQRERPRLQVGLVDPERAAAELVAVADQVVGVRDRMRRDRRRSGRPSPAPAA